MVFICLLITMKIMKKTYPINGNPICPFIRRDCNIQDMDGYTDCSNCTDYGNGGRATGSMPLLGKLFKIIKNILWN